MSVPRFLLTPVALTLVAAAVAGSASRSGAVEKRPPGWAEQVRLPKSEKAVRLFNGRDLTGWEGQIEKYWSVDEGSIRGGNTGPVAASTYLFTKKSYRNFRLLFEVKQTRGPGFSTMHSAIAALGEKFTDHDDPFSFKGPLLMCCNDWGIWDANRRNRVFPAGYKTNWVHPAEKPGDWNQVEMLVLGNRIRVAANGQLVMDFTDDSGLLKESPLGLQLHSNSQPQEWHFRGLILTEKPEDRLLTLAP
jgi:hypothetical protein